MNLSCRGPQAAPCGGVRTPPLPMPTLQFQPSLKATSISSHHSNLQNTSPRKENIYNLTGLTRNNARPPSSPASSPSDRDKAPPQTQSQAKPPQSPTIPHREHDPTKASIPDNLPHASEPVCCNNISDRIRPEEGRQTSAEESAGRVQQQGWQTKRRLSRELEIQSSNDMGWMLEELRGHKEVDWARN